MPIKELLSDYLANQGTKRAVDSSLYVRNYSKEIISGYGQRFLDLGCGFGNVAIKAANEGFSVIGLDISKNAILHNIELKKNYASFLLATGEILPFRDNSFDVIYSNHVLEHIPDDNIAVSEMNRVLRTGGCLLLSVPNINNLHTRFRKKWGCKHPYTDPTHLREYDVKGVTHLLKANGFNIKKIEFSDFIPPVGAKMFHYFVILFNLHEYTNLIASKIFRPSCLSIDIIAEKEEEIKGDDL